MPRAGIFASGRVAGGGGGHVEGFKSTAVDATNRGIGSPYTYLAMPIGAADASRRVIVAITGRNGASLDTATIGGVTATLDGERTGTNHTAIVSAVVPTGTTADVVLTFTGAATSIGIGVWTTLGKAPTGVTASDTTSTYNLSVATAVGDLVVIVNGRVNGTGTPWVGATDRYEEPVEGSSRHHGADAIAVGTPTAVSQTSGVGGAALCAVYS